MKLLLPILVLIFQPSFAQETLRVATAANLKFPIEELIKGFEEQEKINIELITASSGVLYNQIVNSAPFDIYLSADEMYVDKLVEGGFCEEQTKFAKGQLIFWSKSPIPEGGLIQLIENLSPRTVAIAHESLAPFGVVAYNWLAANMPGSFENKLVIGENIGQVNRYIYSGAVEAAFTSNSAQYSFQIANLGNWTAVANSEFINQTGCILSRSKDKSATHTFMKFLLSNNGQSTLLKFGYLSGDATIE